MFRQDRTNPSTAVSNWKGRRDSKRGHPQTAVSTWLNGGLFGGAPFLATGGTETTHGAYKVHTFLSSSNFVIVSGASPAIDILIVAGGGSGCFEMDGGGGGAGGMITQAVGAGLTASTNAVVIGAGGAGVTSHANGNHGVDSDITIGGSTYTAEGGGASVLGYIAATLDGGSGAGGSSTGWSHSDGGVGTVGQGHDGGSPGVGWAGGAGFGKAGGGGGGKGAAGSQGTAGGPDVGGNAGNGTLNDYRTGSNVRYAGGGGGACRVLWYGTYNTTVKGNGGLGGGADGAYYSAPNTQVASGTGDANSGGGGATGSGSSPGYGAAGSGIVVIRYLV